MIMPTLPTLPTLPNPGRGLQALEVVATVTGAEVVVVAAAIQLESDRPRPNSIAGVEPCVYKSYVVLER